MDIFSLPRIGIDSNLKSRFDSLSTGASIAKENEEEEEEEKD